MIPRHQATAPQTVVARGRVDEEAPRGIDHRRERVVFRDGLEPVRHRFHRTNADDTNVTGKRIVKPKAFAASGDDASAMNANTHENA